MTENEAIIEIRNMRKFNYTLADDKVFEMAIKALEEIQQYRAIGTVEELKGLKEKNEPKKIDIWANREEHCPFCDKNLTTFYGFANCFSCGQKLDWE